VVKKLFFLIGFLTITTQSHAAFVLVSSNSAVGGTTPQSITIGVAAGNLVVIGAVGAPQTSSVTLVADNGATGGNTYTQATSARIGTNATNDLFTDIWYTWATKSATSVTVTMTAATVEGGIFAYTFSSGGTGSFDKAGGLTTNTAAASIPGPSIAPAQANEVIVAVCGDTDQVSTAASPYNTNVLTNANGHGAAYNIQTTQTTEAVSFTDVSTGAGCVSSAAFELPGGASASIGRNMGMVIKGGETRITGGETVIK
jgi:hypothetical protein